MAKRHSGAEATLTAFRPFSAKWMSGCLLKALTCALSSTSARICARSTNQGDCFCRLGTRCTTGKCCRRLQLVGWPPPPSAPASGMRHLGTLHTGLEAGARYKYGKSVSKEGHILPLDRPLWLCRRTSPGNGLDCLRVAQCRTARGDFGQQTQCARIDLRSTPRLLEASGRRGFLDWQRISETLIPYAVDLGYAWNCSPFPEHPFDGSWGYQPLGLYAPTARFGSPQGFCDFVAACHSAGLEVHRIDWRFLRTSLPMNKDWRALTEDHL